MTVLPDTKVREMLTLLKWLLIINILRFICITVAAMVLNVKIPNLVMNFKKVRNKTHYIYHPKRETSWHLPKFTERSSRNPTI